MDILDLNGFTIIKESLRIIPDNSKVLINTISPNSYGLAVNDIEMRKALKGSDFLVLDGLYFGLAPLLYKGVKIKRITGWDCFKHFSGKMDQQRGKVFFLGSTKETLKRMIQKYTLEYPNVQVDSYSPPFKNKFDDEDNQAIIDRINQFSPNVLFVGMTAPKQEKWSYEHIEKTNINVICTIGNVFDWYAGNTRRPAKFWQKIGLEWFIRIFLRPEIFKRNIKNQLIFLWHVFTLKFYKI